MNMNTTKNLVPPKLQRKLMLSGLSIPEIGVAFTLAVLGFSSNNMMNSLYWTGLWLVFTVRLYKGESLRSYLFLILQYHFTPQQFTRRILYHAKSHRNGKSH